MFQLLNYDKLPERTQWMRLWRSVPSRSPYLHPAFLGTLRASGERAVCLTYSWDTGTLLFPLALRQVQAATGGDHLLDAHTPIGYGGAFVAGQPSEDGESAAWEAFATHLRELKVVSVFLRLLPIIDGALAPPWRPAHRSVKSNVVVSTREPIDEIWRRYAHKVRKNVKRANREDLHVRFGHTEDVVAEFVSIYHETMERVGAAESVKFTEVQLGALVASLAEGCFIVVVYSGDEPVSAELVLRSNAYLYSFLGGTVPQGFSKRANDYLKHEVCRYASTSELDGYLLGGGSQEDDGIYRYKRSFAPDGDVDYSSLGYILRPEDYAALSTLSHPETDFFPAYRAPGVRAS